LIVSGTELVSEPDVPLMVAIIDPGVADALTFRVKVLPLTVVAGEKDAVTPLGRPVMPSATLPLNPF